MRRWGFYMRPNRSPWFWEDCETFGAGEIVELSQTQHWQPETGGYLVEQQCPQCGEPLQQKSLQKTLEGLRKYLFFSQKCWICYKCFLIYVETCMWGPFGSFSLLCLSDILSSSTCRVCWWCPSKCISLTWVLWRSYHKHTRSYSRVKDVWLIHGWLLWEETLLNSWKYRRATDKRKHIQSSMLRNAQQVFLMCFIASFCRVFQIIFFPWEPGCDVFMLYF